MTRHLLKVHHSNLLHDGTALEAKDRLPPFRQPARPNCGAGQGMPLAQSSAQISHQCVSSCGRPRRGLSQLSSLPYHLPAVLRHTAAKGGEKKKRRGLEPGSCKFGTRICEQMEG